jgi:hypothetical protein
MNIHVGAAKDELLVLVEKLCVSKVATGFPLVRQNQMRLEDSDGAANFLSSLEDEDQDSKILIE